MAADQTVGDVGRLYRGGIESVELITSDLTARGWEQPACGRWNGTQTARHLVAVARWYHDWMDRAIAGDASPPFAAAEMDDRNDEALTAVGCIGGPEAIADFGETARAYLLRAADHWDLAFGYPYGTVTVGLHCGVPATEWHLHAWDLSHSSGHRHQPRDARKLFVAAGMCVAEAEGGLRRALMRLLVPLGSRVSPWQTILKRSGR